MSDKITLADLPRLLAAEGASVNYHKCWSGVVAGQIPAERIGGKWKVDRADVPRIARAMIDGVPVPQKRAS